MAKTRRPNILFILASGLGAWAMGCAGHIEIRTPNLDRLSSDGIRFERFFSVSPASSPARATLLTGQIPSQHGVHDWIRDTDGIGYLDDAPAYTEVLADAGYTCGLVGSWGLGNEARPQKGFTHWLVTGDAEGICHTTATTEAALRFIDAYRASRSPFYLGVHFPSLATSGNLPPQHLDLDDDGAAFDAIGQEAPHPWAIPGTLPGPGEQRHRLASYVAGVSMIDASIGRVLDHLAATGLRDNTIVWLLGDTGFNAGHHGIWGAGNATFPLNMYDTSMRIPAMVRWPGRIPEGVVLPGVFSTCDFAHTVLDQVGLEMPNASALPGRSFARVLDIDARPDRDHVTILGEYGPVRMIRTPAWKYIHRVPYGPHELYDIAHDPDERVNVVDAPGNAEIVTLLRGEIQRWFSRYVDPAVDGVHEEVTGSGQFLRAGTGNGGVLAYDQEHRLVMERLHAHGTRAPTPFCTE